MAKDISGARGPGDEGTKVGGQIQTPMCSENVGRKNTPSILTYKSVVDTGSNKGGGAGIEGPGEKNKY